MADPVIYGEHFEHFVRDGETLQSIAEENGMTFKQLALFNFGTDKPDEINKALREHVGCTKRTKDGKNFIFTDEDIPGILYIPVDKGFLKLKTGKPHRVQVKQPVLLARIELETVDELGHRLGQVDLVLRSTEGFPDVTVTTNKQGHGVVNKLRAGRYKVLLSDDTATSMFDRGDPANKDDDALVDAEIDTANNRDAITRIVVRKSATEEELAERELMKKVYQPPKDPANLRGQGTETQGLSRRSMATSVDNLALAAGWTNDGKAVNLELLFSDTLSGYLRDYHPTVLARGYVVIALVPSADVIQVFSSSGDFEGEFPLNEKGSTTVGRFGAYAAFEQVKGPLFVDLANMTFFVALPDDAGVLGLETIVSEPDLLRERIQEHAGETELLFYTPTAGQLVLLGLQGGTGRLEDYSQRDEVNESIHERNLAVCTSLRLAYRAYINDYIEKVKATSNEDALRKLGPPRSPFEMPTPAGATDKQMTEIFESMHSNVEFDAWVAIAHQLDRFANRLSQGFPFLRIKPKFVVTDQNLEKLRKRLRPGTLAASKSPISGEIEVEINIDVQLVDGEIEVVVKGDTVLKGKVKIDGETVKKRTKKFNAPVEFSAKRSGLNPEKVTTTVKISKYSIEVDTLGKCKMAVDTPAGSIDGEVNSVTGMFGAGFTLKFKEVAKNMRGSNDLLNRWADKLENVEVQFQVGLVGTREETVLAVVSNAPGFFERRSIAELFSPDTDWVDLSLAEQRALITLGWTGQVWDGKYHTPFDKQLPASVKKSRTDLSDPEKVAIIHLGFFAYEDYRKVFDQSVQDFADYSF